MRRVHPSSLTAGRPRSCDPRGVGEPQIALAWLRRHPIVAAPIVGALKLRHIDDAVAALPIKLNDAEAVRLEMPHTRANTRRVRSRVLLRGMEAATGL